MSARYRSNSIAQPLEPLQPVEQIEPGVRGLSRCGGVSRHANESASSAQINLLMDTTQEQLESLDTRVTGVDAKLDAVIASLGSVQDMLLALTKAPRA